MSYAVQRAQLISLPLSWVEQIDFDNSNYSGAPAAEGRQAEPHTHRKVKETQELIFSWLSWLAVLLAGVYDDGGDDGGVAQHGGHTPNNRLTETCS